MESTDPNQSMEPSAAAPQQLPGRVCYKKVGSAGGHIEFELPEIIPVDPAWKIIGNIESKDFSIIGDPFFNVLAYRMDKRSNHVWALGWEHPLENYREHNPGFGFEDGFIYRSAEYVPVSYAMGCLVGLQEVRMDREKDPDVPDIAYVVDRQRFFHKPQWRFRGQKTWIDMEPWQVVDKLQEDLRKRFIRNNVFQPNFNALAVGHYYERSHTLYLSHRISQNHFNKMLSAVISIDERAQVMMYDMSFTTPPADIIFFLLDTAPDSVVLVSATSKPKRMTWMEVVNMARNTQVWPVTAESMYEKVFPIRIVHTDTNTVENL